jgi:phage terminase small subunit
MLAVRMRGVKNPSVAIQWDAVGTLCSLAVQLGFTPDARTKIALGEPAGDDEDSDLSTS